MTPYVTEGVDEYPEGGEGPEVEPAAIDYFTANGYAVAQHHVRGTGSSGGCLEQTAENQISDGAIVVEHLATREAWSDGNVGMYGVSYDAETQISVAGLGDPAKTKYLKAIVPAATVGGQYEYSHQDGVPYKGQALLSNSVYLAGTSVPGTTQPAFAVDRLECQEELYEGSANQSGDMTPFWARREYRPGAPNVRAATLMVHGRPTSTWTRSPRRATTTGFRPRPRRRGCSASGTTPSRTTTAPSGPSGSARTGTR